MDVLAQRTLNIAREAFDVDDLEQRAALVRRLSEGDTELERRVLRLVGEADGLAEAIQATEATEATEATQAAEIAVADPFAAGDRFGPYQLLRPLGLGGMGAVWLAERADGVYRRQVALKLLRGGWLRPDEHFRRERDILARLGHPNIAQLYDGGATGDQPWFALEYVDGELITTWCDQHRLDIRARVGLMLPICAAVQFAHQHLVVHRDIKPANVLVAADGTPKLLDFGIAKLVDQADARQTQTYAMTPAYASPEQRRGEPARTQSDVYQLGLLLYELLVGRSAHQLRSRNHPHAVPRLDQATGLLAADERTAIARARALSPERLRASLRGDLSRIVSKAMADVEMERYESAQGLAQDLENWLAGRPVRAHRGSFTYRARKFVRRNWAISAAVVGLALVSAYYVVDLAEKNRRIAIERDQALAVAGFLQDLFRGANPQETGAPNLSARELLDRGVARLQMETQFEPRMRAQLESTMARSYQGLGIYASARTLYASALKTFRAPGDGNSLLAARTLKDAAASALEASDTSATEENLKEALAFLATSGTHEDISAAYAHGAAAMDLGNLYRAADADAHYTRIVSLRRALFSQDPRFFAEISLLQIDNEAANQRPERAVEVAREAVDLNREALGEDAADYARALGSLADALTDIRQYGEAEKNYLAAIPRMRQTLGPRHRQVGVKLNNLGLLYLRLGRFKEARNTLAEVPTIMIEVYGARHQYLVPPLSYLAWASIELGDMGAAKALVDQAAVIAEAGDVDQYKARTRHLRGRIECSSGDLAAALADFAAARAIYEREADRNLGPALLVHLSECLASNGKADEALALLPAAIDGLERGIGKQAWDYRQAITLKQKLDARIGGLPR